MVPLRFGRFTVQTATDGYLDFDAATFLPGVGAETLAAYPGVVFDGKIRFPLTTYIVRTGEQTVLVDTGIGPRLSSRQAGESGLLPGELQRLGVAPETVALVLFTHLHFDHVGWNCVEWDGTWQPAFPNARYLLHRPEWERWAPEQAGYLDRQVRPLFAAGRLELVEDGHEAVPGVRLLSTPGHTAGHVSILVMDGGEGGVITGDAAHTPYELEHPETGPIFDDNPAQAAVSRRALVDRIEADGLTVLAGHFPPPHAGQILRVGQKRVYRAAAVP